MIRSGTILKNYAVDMGLIFKNYAKETKCPDRGLFLLVS